ncbi:hypothetical protein ACJMQP_23340 [Rhodopseudomonas palustris]
MNKVFLAFSSRPENEAIVRNVERIVNSHGLVLVTGEVLGGKDLTQEIQARIKESDALIAFMTREGKREGEDVWDPTQWVMGEYISACGRGQLAVAIVEDGVRCGGPFAGKEHIAFNRNWQSEGFIRLSEIVGLWRKESGRSIEIRLLPEAAANLASSENVRCEYRLVPRLGEPSCWKETRARLRPGGVFLVVPGVKVDEDIQVKIVEGNSLKWRSAESPQWVHIELKSAQ